jgi:hypothetical protein
MKLLVSSDAQKQETPALVKPDGPSYKQINIFGTKMAYFVFTVCVRTRLAPPRLILFLFLFVFLQIAQLCADAANRTIIFSQHYRTLDRARSLMDANGIKYVICKGNVHNRTKAIRY